MAGKFENIDEGFAPCIEVLGKEIMHHQSRLGGNMAVALAIFSKKQRQALRETIGPNLVTFVLNMTKEAAKKRLMERHGGSLPEETLDMLNKIHDFHELADEDEENTFNLTITEDMSPQDVLEQAKEILAKL